MTRKNPRKASVATIRRLGRALPQEPLPAYEADDGPLSQRDLDAIREMAAADLPRGKLLKVTHLSMSHLLRAFDPELHGGELMAGEPIGLEFAGPPASTRKT